MTKTRLYIARHGKTMFNTIGRAQGWSDTPLTEAGERGIRELGLGLKEAGLSFEEAVSSDSGRTIQTMGIILRELGLTGKIPYRYDKRIREWCCKRGRSSWRWQCYCGQPRHDDYDLDLSHRSKSGRRIGLGQRKRDGFGL